MFENPPDHLLGQFDIVHVRLIMLVIKDNDSASVIRNLYRLLRPGGFLQWDEVDSAGLYIEKTDPSVKKLFKSFALPQGAKRADKWKTDLVRALDDHGFHQSKNLACL